MTVNELIQELGKLQESHGDEQLMVGYPDQYPVSVQVYPRAGGEVTVHFMGGETTLFAAIALPQPQEQVKGYAATYTSYPHAYWCKGITGSGKCNCVGGDIVLDKDL